MKEEEEEEGGRRGRRGRRKGGRRKRGRRKGGRRRFRNTPGRAGHRQGGPSPGWGTCRGTHLGPLARPLLGADGAALLGVERPDEGTNGGATHHVDGDPRLLHRLDHPDVGATPGWTEKIKRRIDESGTATPPPPRVASCYGAAPTWLRHPPGRGRWCCQ